MIEDPHLHATTATASRPDDIRLMSRLAAGDMEAASELYDRYAGQILALARRILRNDGDAEDVVQEVFSQAWRNARRFESNRGSVGAWLLVIARSRSIDRLRALQSRPDNAAEADPESIVDQSVPVPDQLLSEEQASRLRQALETLPDAQRTALELAYYEGLTQSEIARRLTEPLGTVKTRIRTALMTLRQRLRS